MPALIEELFEDDVRDIYFLTTQNDILRCNRRNRFLIMEDKNEFGSSKRYKSLESRKGSKISKFSYLNELQVNKFNYGKICLIDQFK